MDIISDYTFFPFQMPGFLALQLKIVELGVLTYTLDSYKRFLPQRLASSMLPYM